MGRKCCVPGCKSNYSNTSYVSSFLFPKEEKRRDLWIKKINRKYFIPSKTAVVCIHHFSEQFIVREDRAVRDDGTVITVPRIKPKLTEDAYPSIFPNQPSYLSQEPPPKRKTPADRLNLSMKREEEKFFQMCLEDEINSFEQFRDGFCSKLGKDWRYIEQESYILFYRMEFVDVPKITVSFKIFKDLSLTIWHGSILLNINSFQYILQKENKCNKWTKFDCLLNKLGCYKEKDIPINDKFKYAVEILSDYKIKVENDEG